MTEVALYERETNKFRIARHYIDLFVTPLAEQDGDPFISGEEFVKIMDDENCLAALQGVEVDVFGLVDGARAVFGENGENSISLDDFLDMLTQLRGSNAATMKDVIELRKLIQGSADANMQSIGKLTEILANIEAQQRVQMACLDTRVKESVCSSSWTSEPERADTANCDDMYTALGDYAFGGDADVPTVLPIPRCKCFRPATTCVKNQFSDDGCHDKVLNPDSSMEPCRKCYTKSEESTSDGLSSRVFRNSNATSKWDSLQFSRFFQSTCGSGAITDDWFPVVT